jgi:uncharacterized protein (DUF2141 family)
MFTNKLLISLALLAPSIATAELPDLTVRVTNASPATGTLEVTLFNSKESFLKEAYLQSSSEVTESGIFTANFPGLEEGEYAVVVVHDENGNEKYDSGFLGFGAESVGYSNNVQPWLVRPDFNDAKIQIGSDSMEIEIRLD